MKSFGVVLLSQARAASRGTNQQSIGSCHMEGRVFICSWKKVSGGYRLWLAKRPKLSAEAKTLEEADELLWEVICGATGDGENVREYAPPLPTSRRSAHGLVDRLVMASPNAWAEIANTSELFTRAHCPQCSSQRGTRTAAPIELAKAEAGDALLPRRDADGPNPFRLYSADFLALLTARERDSLELRPVIRQRGKKAFFEVTAAAACIPYVAIRGVVRWGGFSRCDTCRASGGLSYIGTAWEKHLWPNPPTWYVAKADLPTGRSSFFVLEGDGEFSLAFTRERWAGLVGKPGTRAIKSNDVGVLSASRVERAPRRKSLRALEKVTGALVDAKLKEVFG